MNWSQRTAAKDAKFIPLRLTADEEKSLLVLQAALAASHYTDAVDVDGSDGLARKGEAENQLTCLVVGMAAVTRSQDREFVSSVFEIGRRHQILHPRKMGEQYGKLIYMVMDYVQLLKKPVPAPVQTVYELLKQHDSLGLLDDPALHTVAQITTAQKRDEAVKRLAASYAERKRCTSMRCPTEVVERAINSLMDQEDNLRWSREPHNAMLGLPARLGCSVRPEAPSPCPGGAKTALA
eukprot:Polyplicarium_translucidae@DN3315_c1_g1_i3.p1